MPTASLPVINGSFGTLTANGVGQASATLYSTGLPWLTRKGLTMRSVKKSALRVAAATVATGVLTVGAAAVAGSAGASTLGNGGNGTAYSFTTLDNASDLTFNQLLGVNDSGEVVGVYTPGDNSQALDGFIWTPQHGFTTLDDPHGVGTTTINGVNDLGQVVGFYVDADGNTDGFLAAPQR